MKKKLGLAKETLRDLSESALQKAAGGYWYGYGGDGGSTNVCSVVASAAISLALGCLTENCTNWCSNNCSKGDTCTCGCTNNCFTRVGGVSCDRPCGG
jgi:hypothetical protein